MARSKMDKVHITYKFSLSTLLVHVQVWVAIEWIRELFFKRHESTYGDGIMPINSTYLKVSVSRNSLACRFI